MTKDTHIAFGVSSSLAIVRPTNLKELAICVGAGIIGGAISDIDSSSSIPRRKFNNILVISIIGLSLVTILEYSLNLSIFSTILANPRLSQALLGFTLFLLVCTYGITTPHRSFMHSITCIIILSGAIGLILPKSIIAFSTAMASHIFLDLFNKKPVTLLYPIKKSRLCFKCCKADGKANKCLKIVGTIIAITELIAFIAINFLK